jgi:hypothetical protein
MDRGPVLHPFGDAGQQARDATFRRYNPATRAQRGWAILALVSMAVCVVAPVIDAIVDR